MFYVEQQTFIDDLHDQFFSLIPTGHLLLDIPTGHLLLDIPTGHLLQCDLLVQSFASYSATHATMLLSSQCYTHLNVSHVPIYHMLQCHACLDLLQY